MLLAGMLPADLAAGAQKEILPRPGDSGEKDRPALRVVDAIKTQRRDIVRTAAG